MDFEYHEDENDKARPGQEASPEDERYAWRILILIAAIGVVVLSLIWLAGGSFTEVIPPP